MLTQMSAETGIEKFGERAVAAIVKEYNQLVLGSYHVKPTIQPIAYKYLAKEDMNRALEVSNLIKENRDGNERLDMRKREQTKEITEGR